jgi:hypothetical protein
MDERQRTALAALRFNWAPVPDDVWRPLPFHVDGLHPAVIRDVLDGVQDARASDGASPIGLVLEGQRGSGKTHLLGWTRQRVQEQGGYFFLVGLLDADGFWESVLAAMMDGLARPVPGSRQTQLVLLLRRLSAMVNVPRSVRRSVLGETELTRAALDAFVEGLGRLDPHVARVSQETARALTLSASEEVEHRELAEDYFAAGAGVPAGERGAWGIRRAPRPAQQIVRELSWLLALTGPSVIAIDQIDTLIAQSAMRADPAHAPEATADPKQALLLARIADGLMSLREVTRRSLTVVACIPTSWTIINSAAIDSVSDRFRLAPRLMPIEDGELGRAIIEKRFSLRYREIGFVPPYPSWPVRPEAFLASGGFTPRQLLIQIDTHIRACIAEDEVRELEHLGGAAAAEPQPARPATPAVSPADLDRLDARFAELKKHADVNTSLSRVTEDATMPGLLAAGLTAWILERGDDGEAFSVDPPPSAKPPLHARLRLTLNERDEDQVHWCFRTISNDHHSLAALHRLRMASVTAGLDRSVAKRRLFLLRNGDWSGGSRTHAALDSFRQAGGLLLALDDEELRVLSALEVMLEEQPVDLRTWLVERKPTRDLRFIQQVNAELPTWTTAVDTPTDASDSASLETPAPEPGFTIGYDFDDDSPVTLTLQALREHVTIFSGSGSGRTVLIRRIVEECALRGVSAIVLDPDDDIVRLGASWPTPPPQWRDGDADKAAEYLANTDVVVWTPHQSQGRPLRLRPLPDFAGVLDDPDEFNAAVEVAVASLAPRVIVPGRTTRSHLSLAVLRKAVEHYGRRGGTRLRGLVDTLADLPDGVVDVDGADKIAQGLAQALTASMVNDPLFHDEDAPTDPGLLLTPAEGKRARVSVVSMIGLPTEEMRRDFVNQLQMALFGWIKKNPASERPVRGLLVMDEAQSLAPAGEMTACTQSTLALAAQARSYGLGLIFASRAPQSLHSRVPRNTATRLYGLLNSPIQIASAREMAQAKGDDVPDISRLAVGEFYLSTEGMPQTKIRTPLSLSHHLRSPLTRSEVLAAARR